MDSRKPVGHRFPDASDYSYFVAFAVSNTEGVRGSLKNAHIIIEGQSLLHENRQLALLLKEYETTMAMVVVTCARSMPISSALSLSSRVARARTLL